MRVWDLEAGTAVHTLTGHAGAVRAVAVSADGRRAVSGGTDRTVRVWDLEAGTAVHTLTGHDGSVDAVAVSADGRRAVSGGYDATVRVWDLEAGTAVHTLTGHDGSVWAVAVSADGRRAVSGGYDGTVRVWDLEAGTAVHTLTGHDGPVWAVAVSAGRPPRSLRRLRRDGAGVGPGGRHGGAHPDRPRYYGQALSVAVSADGRRAVSGGYDGTVQVWDLARRARRALTGHDRWVAATAVSADGQRVISGGYDGTVRVWDLVAIGEPQHAPMSSEGDEIPSDGASNLAELYHSATQASCGSATFRPVGPLHPASISGHHGWVTGVGVSADGRRAVSVGDDESVRVWDFDSGELLHTLTGHIGAVTAVAVSANGGRAVSGGRDGLVQVWNLFTGEPLLTLTGHVGWVSAVAVSADGRLAVSGSTGHYETALETRRDDASVRMWDLDTGQPLPIVTDYFGWVTAVAVSADGQRTVSGSYSGTMRVWDQATGKMAVIAAKRRHWFATPVIGRGLCCSISADGQRAVSGGEDGTVQLWNLGARERPRTLDMCNHNASVMAVEVRGSRQRAVFGSDRDGMVRGWGLAADGPSLDVYGHNTSVMAVAVSADGRRAVSTSDCDGMVRVWDLATGERLHTLVGHDDVVRAIAISADGRRAVSGGKDGTMRLWDLVQGVELASFVSESEVTTIAITPSGARAVAGTSTGPVHLLELCGCEL